MISTVSTASVNWNCNYGSTASWWGNLPSWPPLPPYIEQPKPKKRPGLTNTYSYPDIRFFAKINPRLRMISKPRYNRITPKFNRLGVH